MKDASPRCLAGGACTVLCCMRCWWAIPKPWETSIYHSAPPHRTRCFPAFTSLCPFFFRKGGDHFTWPLSRLLSLSLSTLYHSAFTFANSFQNLFLPTEVTHIVLLSFHISSKYFNHLVLSFTVEGIKYGTETTIVYIHRG